MLATIENIVEKGEPQKATTLATTITTMKTLTQATVTIIAHDNVTKKITPTTMILITTTTSTITRTETTVP